VKVRSSLLLLPVAAALSLGTLAPAQAAVTDPVTDLQVHVEQALGTPGTWKVTATWTPNADTSAYSVVIADHSDGTVTPGKYFGNQDVSGNTATITTSKLADNGTYYVDVEPQAAGGEAVVQPFTATELVRTPPSGAYTLNRTSGYITMDLSLESDDLFSASFRITQTAIDAGVTRKVLAGDGSVAKAWPSGNRFTLSYTKAGTYTPTVELTDRYGNTNAIALPAVHVLEDRIKPTISITKPAKPSKIASWRVIRGTASDVGSGLQQVMVLPMEKRGTTWWSYDARKHKWLKGSRSMTQTRARSKAMPLTGVMGANGRWHTSAIKGLTRGTVHIEAVAIDKVFNFKLAKALTQKVR